MLGYDDIVMFAIYAGMRLGQKAVSIYGDVVRDASMTLPPVDADNPAIPSWPVAQKFFKGAGKAFVAAGGLYAQWWLDEQTDPKARDKLCNAYYAIQQNINIQKPADLEDLMRRPDQFYAGSYALLRQVKQWQEGADPKRHPVQRLAGTLVELALDYVKMDPTLFGGNGKGDRVLRGFLLSLDDVQFAEKDCDDLLVDIAQASLKAFQAQAGLVISDRALLPLFQNLSGTLADEFRKVSEDQEPDKLLALVRVRREMLEHLVGTTAATVSGYPDDFLGTSRGEQLLKGVLKASLTAVQEHPDLFSSGALTAIYTATLKAAAQNAALLVPDGDGQAHVFLTNLITALAQKLSEADASPASLFSLAILPQVTEIALGVVAQNAHVLIIPDNPGKQLLADALAQVTQALSADLHGDQKLAQKLQALLSRDNLLALLQEVFGAVAQHPEILSQGVANGPQRSALAEIVGSVAAAAAADTKNLLNGAGFVKLLGVALQAFTRNPDRLFDLIPQDPQKFQTIMAKVLISASSAASRYLADGGRNLFTGETLVQLMDAALAAVSQNTDGFKKEVDIVTMTMNRLLTAASQSLKNRLDATNLLTVFAPILRLALEGPKALEGSDTDLILPHLPTS